MVITPRGSRLAGGCFSQGAVPATLTRCGHVRSSQGCLVCAARWPTPPVAPSRVSVNACRAASLAVDVNIEACRLLSPAAHHSTRHSQSCLHWHTTHHRRALGEHTSSLQELARARRLPAEPDGSAELDRPSLRRPPPAIPMMLPLALFLGWKTTATLLFTRRVGATPALLDLARYGPAIHHGSPGSGPSLPGRTYVRERAQCPAAVTSGVNGATLRSATRARARYGGWSACGSRGR